MGAASAQSASSPTTPIRSTIVPPPYARRPRLAGTLPAATPIIDARSRACGGIQQTAPLVEIISRCGGPRPAGEGQADEADADEACRVVDGGRGPSRCRRRRGVRAEGRTATDGGHGENRRRERQCHRAARPRRRPRRASRRPRRGDVRSDPCGSTGPGHPPPRAHREDRGDPRHLQRGLSHRPTRSGARHVGARVPALPVRRGG